MKEFCNKNPLFATILGVSMVSGVVKIVKIVAYAITKDVGVLVATGGSASIQRNQPCNEEDQNNESETDIQ